MRKAVKIILLVLYWLLYLTCLFFGALNMPSGIGAVFLFIAMFLTPQVIADSLKRIPYIRWVCLFLAYWYLHYMPDGDIQQGAHNFGSKILRYKDIWQGIATFFAN